MKLKERDIILLPGYASITKYIGAMGVWGYHRGGGDGDGNDGNDEGRNSATEDANRLL